jgi:membrane-bound inhibitor of C-type lysozyme
MADTNTYACTPDKLTALAAELAQNGITVDLTKDGEVVDGKWDVAWALTASTITLTVKSHPFLEEGIFWSKVESALASA